MGAAIILVTIMDATKAVQIKVPWNIPRLIGRILISISTAKATTKRPRISAMISIGTFKEWILPTFFKSAYMTFSLITPRYFLYFFISELPRA